MFGGGGVSFNPDKDIAKGSLDSKVIIVTGGNVGLGHETIKQLAKHNPGHIYMASRSRDKAETAIKELQESFSSPSKSSSISQSPSITQPTAPKISFLELDLTSFASIKAAAKKFTSENDRLDVLINNAGIMACPEGTTKEGYEIQFGTNHLGHALFTSLLLPTLQKTAAADASPGAARIVNLSSGAEAFAPASSWTFAQMSTPSAGIGTWQRYGQSKLANIHFTRALADKYPDITSVAIHPGGVSTNLVNSGPAQSYPLFAGVMRTLTGWLLTDVKQGALNQIWAATAPLASEANGHKGPKSGVFYHPVGLAGKDSKLAKDEKLTQSLWEWTEKQLEGHTMDN